MNESICYLLRKTSLNLKDIGQLTPAQFNAIVKEVQFQESVESYERHYMLANILAAIYNTIPTKSNKVYNAKDFIGVKMPVRDEERIDSNIEALALKKGIILP